jgi:hypothetical protein
VTTTTAGPTTTVAPMGISTATPPANYVKHTQPNPDLAANRTVFFPPAGGQPTLYIVRRTENGQTLPAPSGPTGAGATSGGANGWTVVVTGTGDFSDGIAKDKIFKTKVSYHASGASPGNDKTPGPWDYFGFTPALPGLTGNHAYTFYFAPTATGGGRRRRRGSRRSRGRKGTRRH